MPYFLKQFASSLAAPMFGGVTWSGQQPPHVWKVGANHQSSLNLEVFVPGKPVQTVALAADAQKRYWVMPTLPDSLANLKGDTFYYRFKDAQGQPQLDFTETFTLENGDAWNVARKTTGPQRTGSLLYAYVDSHLASEEAQKANLTHPEDALSTHAPLDVTRKLGGNIKGVLALLEKLNDDQLQAVGGVMLTPHTGDWATPHRYQTTDPFVLNEAFENGDFEALVNQSIQKGVKLYADGAFVNAGFESPIYQSLLLHGPRSPFWRWFLFEDNQVDPKTGILPDIAANQKLVLGSLPVTTNPHGGWEIDWPHVGLRVENAPNQPNYQPGQPTYLVQFDPHPEVKQWTPPEHASQSYRWPLSPQALLERLAHSGLPKETTQVTGKQAAVLLEWPTFRLGRPDEDNSGYKWDGKVPAIRMDLRNPEALTYAQKALTYWTQRARSKALAYLAQALSQAAPLANSTKDWQKAVETLYAKKALPPPPQPIEITPPQPLPVGEKATPQELLNALWQNAPLLSIPLPREALTLKATLAWPKFEQEVLDNAGAWVPATAVASVLGRNNISNRLTQWKNSKTINGVLAQKLARLVEALPPSAQQALATPAGRDILMMAIGPELVRLLLTNQQSNDPKIMAAGLHQVFGPQALLADPETAAKAIRPKLLRQAQQLPILDLLPLATQVLENLSSEHLQVIEQILSHHELGLNWRLDAAKDVANVDAARNAPTDYHKEKRFVEEMTLAQRLWQQLLAGARDVFPQMAVVAELTQIGPLAGKASQQVFQSFLTPPHCDEASTFTGVTNMDTFYSSLLRLIHHDPKPNEFGNKQMQVQAEGDAAHVGYHSFWDAVVTPMVRNFPKQSNMFSQTLTASHDYPHTLYNLLRNPVINDMDRATHRGLEDDARDMLTAMAYRADFIPLRQLLKQAGVNNPQAALLDLQDLILDVDLKQLPELMQPLASKDSKEAFKNQQTLNRAPGNSLALRQTYAQALLKTAQTHSETSSALKRALTDSHYGPPLRAALQQGLTTPGEVWAIRAALTNAYETLKIRTSNAKKSETNNAEKDADTPIPQPTASSKPFLSLPAEEAFYTAMNDIQAKYNTEDARLPGYLTLTTWVDELGSALWPEAPHGEAAKAFKNQLFHTILKPAFEKDRRRLALMVALPGQPTWYDFFRTGGELMNNRYLQNRELVRLDWLNNKDMAYIQKEMAENRKILSLRQRFPVLNHGELQNLKQDGKKGVLIAAWDGGPVLDTAKQMMAKSSKSSGIVGQQAILLVNTGKPRSLEGYEYDQVLGQADTRTYPDIPLEQPGIEGYEPDISQLRQPAGTRYRDAENGDEYVVDKNGILQLTKGEGRLETYKLLIRQ